MTISAEFLLPGDNINLDDIPDARERNKLLDEIEGMGYVLNSRGTLGLIETCEECEGDGLDKRTPDRNCRMCAGSGTTIDEGRGKKPHWD